jgi:hypothetical protein
MNQQPSMQPPDEPLHSSQSFYPPPNGPFPPQYSRPLPPPGWQPPYQPPAPRPSGVSGFWRWYRGAGRPLQVVLGCGGALLLLCVCFSSIGVFASANQGAIATPTAIAQAPTRTPVSVSPTSRPTATPTPKPTATPTPSGPHIINDATFGGTRDAFTAKYGQPVASSPGGAQYLATLNGVQVRIYITFTDEKDGKQHAWGINLEPRYGTWDTATANKVYPALLPRDANPTGKTTQLSGFGSGKVYLSPNLGMSFDTGAFFDKDLNDVTPGTFYVAIGQGWFDNGGCFQVGYRCLIQGLSFAIPGNVLMASIARYCNGGKARKLFPLSGSWRWIGLRNLPRASSRHQ